MKIQEIFLSNFHQFNDLTIDLKYPKGHKKEGSPLDKICFIGQSGTGKTSLLELIPKFIHGYNTQLIIKSGEESLQNCGEISFLFGFENEYNTRISFSESKKDENETRWLWNYRTLNGLEINSDEFYTYFKEEWFGKIASKMIYFPSNLNFEFDDNDNDKPLSKNRVIDFSTEKVASVWNLILEKIQTYQEYELQIRQEISKIVEQDSINLNKITEAVKKLEDWKKTEFNPIQDIADNCLNNLLKAFKLRVKTELDIKIKEDIGFIKIEDYEGNEIPNGLWSTGTKQIVLSALPLYLLKPEHTIILFDEPERSLYPDLQRLIVDFYYSLTKDCQFFYATHSPIIASSFEPWEIVELKFNSEGHVYRELYFEGDDHIKNYKYNPRYMRWDDILQRVFDMENDGSTLRKEKLDELATLNVKYKKLEKQNKSNTRSAKILLNRIQKLSKELSTWENNHEKNK